MREMFGKEFQRKYALTDQGIRNIKQGTFWTVIVNLVVMGGMGILYLMMSKYMAVLTDGQRLPGAVTFLLLVLAFLVLSVSTHLQQYRNTYGLVYGEVRAVRIGLAERLRKLPLGYFGKRNVGRLQPGCLVAYSGVREMFGKGLSLTGGWRLPACGAFRWRLRCFSAAGN